jgi:hypothetical protein
MAEACIAEACIRKKWLSPTGKREAVLYALKKIEKK